MWNTFGRIDMNKKALKKIAVFLISVTLFSLLGSLGAPDVMAQGPTVSISHTDGFVGDTIMVNGTIETLDGSFTVRWNQASNYTGVAEGNTTSVSFNIPPTAGAPSGRNVTVELIDETLDIVVASTNFTLYTKFDIQVGTPLSPKQLQQGTTVRLNATVTGGEPNTVYKANITVRNAADQTRWVFTSLSNTTTSGSGSAAVIYPTNFTTGANMNYTGIYKAYFNETTAAKEFFVGLTDKSEYRRNEDVLVQAAGYKPSEVVKADIRIAEASVVGFPKNSTASSAGLVTLSWKIPSNASRGTYRITLTNATSTGTSKSPADVQEFKVLGVTCLVQARNLADEAVEGALIEAYNASATTIALNKGNTNSTGWIRFNLDKGNHTFKAFVKSVQVGLLANEVLAADTELHMQLSLANFLATVRTEEGEGVPLINIALRDNKTGTETATVQTNATGMATLRNLFTNKTYRIEARRYGLLFSNTTRSVESSPALGWISLNLTLPNHTMSVHAIDSKGSNAAGIGLKVYEWASGVTIPIESAGTNSSGDAFFSLPFGRYILRAFKGGDFLSETVVDLVKSSTFAFDLVTLNVDVVVSVLDYFGQPLANAEVKIERKIGQDFALISTQFTGSAGSAQFAEIVGGDSRVSVYLGGKLAAVKAQFLGAGSNEVAFKVTEYVAVLGYPVSTGTFALFVFTLLLIAVVLVAARRRIIQMLRKPSKR